MSLNGYPIVEGSTGAPIFEDAIGWMECEVREAVACGTHTLFIGELVAAGVNDDEARPASMSDTRMKYGGTRRGH
jgi:flavin reductase (DIM6/NTAB) family NADH-FMN oxidoreductase RutF